MAQAQRQAETQTAQVGDAAVTISRNRIEIVSKGATLTYTFNDSLPGFRRSLERARAAPVGRAVPRRTLVSSRDQTYQSALANLERVYEARRNNLLLAAHRIPGLNRLLDGYEQLQRDIREHPGRADELRSNFRKTYRSDVEYLFSSYTIARTLETPNRLMLVRP